MTDFDSATSSFQALLINQSYEKTEKTKIQNTFQIRDKKVQNHFVSKVLWNNPSPRPEKFRWPVMVVKHRKGQKLLTNFG